MVIACKPIIPMGVLTNKNRPTAIDFDILSSSFENPILRYDDKQMRLITVLTNSLLEIASSENVLAEKYPSLNERFNEGSLTEEEVSEFLNDSGILPGFVENTYENEFPVDIDIPAINEAINEIKNNIQESLDQIRRDNQTASIPIPTTVEEAIPTPLPTAPILNWSPGGDMDSILGGMDSYYKDNRANSFQKSNQCSSIPNPFSKLASLIAMAAGAIQAGKEITSFKGNLSQLVTDTITRIFNFPDYIVKMASLSMNLEKMKEDLLNMANNLIGEMKSKLGNLKQTANTILGSPGMSRSSIRFIMKKMNQVETFLSDSNAERIKAKVKSVLTINEEQFEDLLPLVLELLSTKVCGLSNFLENILKKPIEELKKLLTDLDINKNILENYSVLKTNRVIDAGGMRLGTVERNTERTNHANQANQAEGNSPGELGEIVPAKHIQLEMSAEEVAFVNSLTADYSDLFEFQPSVKAMGDKARSHWEASGRDSVNWIDSENYKDSGWSVVAEKNPYVYAALGRVSKRLRNDGLLSGPLLINSAFRSRYYNREVITGGAHNSFHMQGMALDIADTSSLSEEGSARFIDYASEEGFTRFGVYNTFIHIDIASSGPPVFKTGRSSDVILFALERHKQRRSRA